MRTVRTEDELKTAFAEKETSILVKGPMAERIVKKAKTRITTKIGGISLVLASLLAIPFTGGASAIGVGAGFTMGGLVLTAGKLAILCGFALGVYGIYKFIKVRRSKSK